MTARATASALPHPAPDVQRDYRRLVLFLVALQVLIVTGVDRWVDDMTATLRAKLPEASETILHEAPRPPVTRLARA